MSAYLNALREEATREELLREVERQQRRADEAWNEALEEAARWCEQENLDGDPDDLFTGRAHRAAAIRALKRD